MELLARGAIGLVVILATWSKFVHFEFGLNKMKEGGKKLEAIGIFYVIL